MKNLNKVKVVIIIIKYVSHSKFPRLQVETPTEASSAARNHSYQTEPCSLLKPKQPSQRVEDAKVNLECSAEPRSAHI